MSARSSNAAVLHHSHGTLLHVRASHVERNADVELVGHGLALDQAELADVVAVVRGVNDVGVVQLPRLHQHVVHLQEDSQTWEWKCCRSGEF